MRRLETLESIIENLLFKGIELEELNKVMSRVEYRVIEYSKGETVAFRGDEVKGLYIILNGSFITEMMKENGEIKRIEALEKNKIIASAFIFGRNNFFPVDLISETKSEMLYIDRRNLMELMRIDERIMLNFLNEISNKGQFLSKKLWSTLNNKSISEKLATYIVENSRGGYIEFKPSLKEVANYFGVARPSLSRVIGELVEDGILEKGDKRGSYKVIDEDSLKNRG